jgi:hypothetical protein
MDGIFDILTLVVIFLTGFVIEKQNVEIKAQLKRIEEKLDAKEGKE